MTGVPFDDDPARDLARYVPELADSAVAALAAGDRERAAKIVATACAIWPRGRRELMICADELDRLRRRIAQLRAGDALVAVLDDALRRLDGRVAQVLAVDERERRRGTR